MGYADIGQLYNTQDILMFRECYAMEKLHGTSAHIRYTPTKDPVNPVGFFSGGEPHDKFVALFDVEALKKAFNEIFGGAAEMADSAIVVHGEAYGGKQQGMSHTYGPTLKFCVFDVRVGDVWLNVPNAEDVAKRLGLEFVHYVKISTELAAIDAERDADSVQAVRNGMGSGHKREGVVLRPLVELRKNNGERLIAKHKRAEFAEHLHPPKVVDPAKMEVMRNAHEIAEQWVVPMRMEHILDGHPEWNDMKHTPFVIKAMLADVQKENKGEFVETKEITTAIGKKTADLWKKRVKESLRQADPAEQQPILLDQAARTSIECMEKAEDLRQNGPII